MKIIYGNILNEKRGIIVHGVSCRGVMGAGVALTIKQHYPKAFNDYQKRCYLTSNIASLLGEVVTTRVSEDFFIVNAFTQRNYGQYHTWGQENYDAIQKCFHKVNILAKHYNLPVFFPMIGAGLGKGDWLQIKEIILNTLDKDVDKTLYILQEPIQIKNCTYCD